MMNRPDNVVLHRPKMPGAAAVRTRAHFKQRQGPRSDAQVQEPLVESGSNRSPFAAHLEHLVGNLVSTCDSCIGCRHHIYLFFSFFQFGTVEGYLSQSIFIADPEQPYLFVVNFSPRVLLMFQEIHCAFQCGIRVPTVASFIYSRRGVLLRMRDEAQVSVSSLKVVGLVFLINIFKCAF